MQIDSWAGTGSANYDYRSMVLNLDTLLFFRLGQTTLLKHYAKMKAGSRLAGNDLTTGGLRARLLMPFRWLL